MGIRGRLHIVAKQGRAIEIAKRWIALQSKRKVFVSNAGETSAESIQTRTDDLAFRWLPGPWSLATFSQLATLAFIQGRAEHWRRICVNVELQKRHPRPGRVDVFAHITLLMQTGELDQAS
jgi:hypothetical protein